MTKQTKKSWKKTWDQAQDQVDAVREKGMKHLTIEQTIAINEASHALNSSVQTIRNLDDLMLSDIKLLDEACSSLYHQFNLEDKPYYGNGS